MPKDNKKGKVFAGPGITFGGAPIKPPKPSDPTAKKKDKPTPPKVTTTPNATNAALWEDTSGAKTPKTSTRVNGEVPMSSSATTSSKPVAGPPKPTAKPTAKPDNKGGKGFGGIPAAAAAVAGAVQSVGNSVASAAKGNKKPSASSTASYSSPSTSSASAPAAPKKPKPPGAVYRATRSAYKSEQANQPRQYETPEQAQSRQASSKFDWSMSGADVKAARKEFLKSHPAAAKAVAKGTLSMGDINLTVRRMKKKNAAAAPAAPTE